MSDSMSPIWKCFDYELETIDPLKLPEIVKVKADVRCKIMFESETHYICEIVSGGQFDGANIAIAKHEVQL